MHLLNADERVDVRVAGHAHGHAIFAKLQGLCASMLNWALLSLALLERRLGTQRDGRLGRARHDFLQLLLLNLV